MDRDEYADMFRFPMGACVRWAEQPSTRFYISHRRWTQREILAPVVQYRFRTSKPGTAYRSVGYEWVYEADIEAWEETP